MRGIGPLDPTWRVLVCALGAFPMRAPACASSIRSSPAADDTKEGGPPGSMDELPPWTLEGSRIWEGCASLARRNRKPSFWLLAPVKLDDPAKLCPKLCPRASAASNRNDIAAM